MKIDPFVAGTVSAMALGLALPVSAKGCGILSAVADLSACLVFPVHGMRLCTGEVLAGLTSVKLQLSVLLAAYVALPAFGFPVYEAAEPLWGHEFATGFLYLSILPLMIQSSVALVSIVKGNMVAAVCSATIPNIFGMFVTPFLVLLAPNAGGASGGGLGSIAAKLLASFIVGQLFQSFVGGWFRARRSMVRKINNSSIIFIMLSTVVNATVKGAWVDATVWTVLVPLTLSVALLATMLILTQFVPRKIGIPREDRIVVLTCGSKKSLATRLPIAGILFPASMVGAVIVPVVPFHQIRIFVRVIIVVRLGQTMSDDQAAEPGLGAGGAPSPIPARPEADSGSLNPRAVQPQLRDYLFEGPLRPERLPSPGCCPSPGRRSSPDCCDSSNYRPSTDFCAPLGSTPFSRKA